MSIGIGIFLGLVFLGLVILYTKNRDTINMKKILKWLGILVGCLLGLLVLFFLWIYLSDLYNSRPKIVNEFQNIKLGESVVDVKFKVGRLTLDRKGTDLRSGYVLPTDGMYDLENKKTSLNIVDSKVESIFYECANSSDYSSINSISCGDSGEKILQKFGSNVQIFCLTRESKDYDKDLIRSYETQKYNVRYILHKNSVFGFIVASKDKLTSKESWSECK